MQNEEKRRERTQIMTAAEVAKFLGVHQITVYRLVKETDMPAFKLKGQWRFKKDLLDEWIVKSMKERKDLDEKIK
jgi:excisionase family DNA binding protein